jgi:SNF2 family DNA or RNA helicase
MKQKAKLNVQEAAQVKKAHIQLFEVSLPHEIEERPHPEDKDNHSPPALFSGDLKNYQLEGLNWLDELFDKVNHYFILKDFDNEF